MNKEEPGRFDKRLPRERPKAGRVIVHPYATAAYARSLGHWGEALAVPEWGCSVIVRPLPDGSSDASGTYPIAILAKDADLAGGLARLRAAGLVAVTLVLDDIHRPPLPALEAQFDVVRPFKSHFIRRNALPFAYDRHHRYRIKRAYRSVLAGPLELGPDWLALYATLKQRHRLAGVHDFPPSYFEQLQALPGVTAFGAWMEGTLVSAQIWVSAEGHSIGHLAASSPAGYCEGAAYAAYDASMTALAGEALVNLGGGAGLNDDPGDGLAVFKRGFCNDVARSYICGTILDASRYGALVRQSGPHANPDYFPLYRG